MKVLYGVCSWGLGHATRSLPIIKKLVDENNRVTVVAEGRPLSLLKRELGDSVNFHVLKDYPQPYTESALFLAKFSAYLPRILAAIAKEKLKIKLYLLKNPQDCIISDNRYGIGSSKIPSYFIGHQLRFIAPHRLKSIENTTELFNFSFIRQYNKYIVPDTKRNNLSGELSHNMQLFSDNEVEYIGHLSSFKKEDTKQDIDYYFTISGPEPARKALQKIVMKQLHNLPGKIVVNLGQPEKSKIKSSKNIKIFSSLAGVDQEDFMNRAKIIVSRSGYSTIMDLAELQKKSLLIPTPSQTEQEYLAEYHNKKRNCYAVTQKSLKLAEDLKRAQRSKGFKQRGSTKKSVEKFMQIISK